MIGHYGAVPYGRKRSYGYGATAWQWLALGPLAASPEVAYATASSWSGKLLIAQNQLSRWTAMATATANAKNKLARRKHNTALRQVALWKGRVALAKENFERVSARKEERRGSRSGAPALEELLDVGTGLYDQYIGGGGAPLPETPTIEPLADYSETPTYVEAGPGAGMPSWTLYAAGAGVLLALAGGVFYFTRGK